MSGISLDYHIDFEQPVRAMRALSVADRAGLMSNIAEFVVVETHLNFDNQTAPDGTPWTPSERGLIEGKTLQDHGHLRDSITYILDTSAESVEIGSNMEYAAIHQFGGQAGRNKSVEIEARPYLGITPDMQNEIGDLVIQFHDEVLSRVS